MTNESILISEVIPATPQRIFTAWMDSAEHSAFTGDEATVVPEVGGEHRSAGGYIQGRTLELNEGSRIVQSWRTTEFPPESPDSRVEITLEPTLGGTLVTLLHTDIPVGQGDRYRQGWNEYYLSRMKSYFADDGDELSSDLSEMRREAGAAADDSTDDTQLEVADADVIDIRPTHRAPVRKTSPRPKASAADAVTATETTPTTARAAPAPVKAAARGAARSKSKANGKSKATATRAKAPKAAARRSGSRSGSRPAKKTAARRVKKTVKKRMTRTAAARRSAKKSPRPAARRSAKTSGRTRVKTRGKTAAKRPVKRSVKPAARKLPKKAAKAKGGKAKGGKSARARR